jgi:hypothetical protein
LRAFFELVKVSEGVDIRLLHHVFHVHFFIHHGTHRAIDAPVMPPHQHLEQCGFTLTDLPDDFRVRQHRGRRRRNI